MIHHVFANKSNVGDWLSALGIQSLLEPFEVREYFCDTPFVDETLERLSEASQGDLIVIGGGGLFMDYFMPFWQGFRQIVDRVPFCIWGVGYCDLKREASRPPQALVEEIVCKSRLCILRDDLSRYHLSRCPLTPPVACPSMAVVKNLSPRGYGLLHVDNYTTAGAEVYEAMDVFGREFAIETQRPYRTTNNQIPSGSQAALARTIALYADADIVLSSSLHGCVIAVAMGRKILAVSGDHKIESFLQAAGLGEWVCDIDDTDSIPEGLHAISDQPAPWQFIERSRRDNESVGERLRMIARKPSG